MREALREFLEEKIDQLEEVLADKEDTNKEMVKVVVEMTQELMIRRAEVLNLKRELEEAREATTGYYTMIWCLVKQQGGSAKIFNETRALYDSDKDHLVGETVLRGDGMEDFDITLAREDDEPEQAEQAEQDQGSSPAILVPPHPYSGKVQ